MANAEPSRPEGVEEWVRRVAASQVLAAHQVMSQYGGAAPPPQVHAFTEDAASPLIGYASTRPFYVGDDAVHAIERLGRFAAAVGASRVLVSWEQTDLCRALGADPEADGVGSGLVQVTAVAAGGPGCGEHRVVVHPLALVEGPPPPGAPRFADHDDVHLMVFDPNDLGAAELPVPIESLLAEWLNGIGRVGTVGAVTDELTGEGYTVRFVQRN